MTWLRKIFGCDGSEAALFAALLFGAACLKAYYLFEYFEKVPFVYVPIADSAYYHEWAKRVASGEGYGPSPYYMAPLYPTLLGYLYRVLGPKPEIVPFLQSFLGIFNIFLIARLSRQILGPWTGFFAGLFVVFYSPLLFLESKLLSETLSVTLLLLAVMAGCRAVEQRGVGWFLVFGGLMGLCAVARPNLLFFAGLVGLWFAQSLLRRQPVAHGKSVIFLMLGLVATIAPVTIRNIVVGDDFVLISSNGGIVFAQGNHPQASGISTILPGFTAQIEEQQEQEMRLAGEALGKKVKPSESSLFWFKRGLQFALDDPVGFAWLWLRKALWSLHSREPRDVYNIYLEAELVPLLRMSLPFPVILGFALFWALKSKRPWQQASKLAWLGIASIALSLIVFSTSFRYRAPCVPLLAPFAGAGFLLFIEALRRRHAKVMALCAFCVVILSSVSLLPYPIPKVTAEAPANFGAAFLKLGQYAEAFAWTQRALAMDPSLASANYNFGLILKSRGDLAGAAEAFRASLRSRPDDAKVRNDLAVTLDEMGLKEEAAKEYRRALQAKPDGRIAYNLALVLFDLGRFEEAREALHLAKSLGQRPDPRFEEALGKKPR